MKIICVWLLWYGARQRIFSHFGPSFALLHPPRTNNPENQNFEQMKKKKKKKNTWRYQHFTQVYHKSQSYHIWFLRYEVHQTEFFCHLGPFFALLPPWQPEKWKFQNKKKRKKIAWEISSFYTSVPKIMIICHTGPEIWHVTVVVTLHFGLFFAILPQ